MTDAYTALARRAVAAYLNGRVSLAAPKNLPPELLDRRTGVFVTIFNGDDLRGCIGTYLPCEKNIAEEIIANAIAACSRDGRFPNITADEMPKLRFEVSILSEPVPLKDLKLQDTAICGLVVKTADGRCGLLLPGLEGIERPQQQLSIAARKGGIDPSQDLVRLFTFRTEKHEEAVIKK